MASYLFLFLLGFSLLGLVGIYLLVKAFANIRPSEQRLRQDLEKMRAEVSKLNIDLAPITKEELDLFALEQVNTLIKKHPVITARGVFTTIYHEPVAAYSFKRYVSRNLNALLYVRTLNKEFIYRFQDKEVKIIMNNQPFGTIKANGALYSARDGKILARLNQEVAGLLPVVTRDRELGSINTGLTADKKGLNSRAFQYVNDMNQEEENLFLSLSLLQLVKRAIPDQTQGK
jgi:hypothetical protein